MIEKKCTKCNKIKPVSCFHKQKIHKSGYKSSCKDCRKNEGSESGLIYRKNKYKSNTHSPLVYLLPNENWVGTTENLSNRLSCHMYADKRDVSDARVLASFDSRQEALELEEFLHSLGYCGRHKNNRYV